MCYVDLCCGDFNAARKNYNETYMFGAVEHLSSPKRSWETTIFQPTQDVTW